jgi:hypothetical protein
VFPGCTSSEISCTAWTVSATDRSIEKSRSWLRTPSPPDCNRERGKLEGRVRLPRWTHKCWQRSDIDFRCLDVGSDAEGYHLRLGFDIARGPRLGRRVSKSWENPGTTVSTRAFARFTKLEPAS